MSDTRKTAHIVCYSLPRPVQNMLRGLAKMRCHCHNCGTAWAAGDDGWIFCPHCGAQNNAIEVTRAAADAALACANKSDGMCGSGGSKKDGAGR